MSSHPPPAFCCYTSMTDASPIKYRHNIETRPYRDVCPSIMFRGASGRTEEREYLSPARPGNLCYVGTKGLCNPFPSSRPSFVLIVALSIVPFRQLRCLNFYPCCAPSWRSIVPRPTTVPKTGTGTTEPLTTSWPRHLPFVKGSCAYGPLRHSFQTASTRPRARICGGTFETAFPRRATQPAGRTSNAPSSASMASVRA